jgi:hypothetical protein
MKGQTALANSLFHLKVAEQYMTSFVADNPGTYGASLLKQYAARVGWILRDVVTNPKLPDEARNGLKNDLKSDLLVIPAIAEKIALLTEDNREAVEMLVDMLVRGEKLTVVEG